MFLGSLAFMFRLLRLLFFCVWKWDSYVAFGYWNCCVILMVLSVCSWSCNESFGQCSAPLLLEKSMPFKVVLEFRGQMMHSKCLANRNSIFETPMWLADLLSWSRPKILDVSWLWCLLFSRIHRTRKCFFSNHFWSICSASPSWLSPHFLAYHRVQIWREARLLNDKLIEMLVKEEAKQSIWNWYIGGWSQSLTTPQTYLQKKDSLVVFVEPSCASHTAERRLKHLEKASKNSMRQPIIHAKCRHKIRFKIRTPNDN